MATYLIELTAVGAGAMFTEWVNEKPGKYGVGQTGTAKFRQNAPEIGVSPWFAESRLSQDISSTAFLG